jgi:hypothetical protein
MTAAAGLLRIDGGSDTGAGRLNAGDDVVSAREEVTDDCRGAEGGADDAENGLLPGEGRKDVGGRLGATTGDPSTAPSAGR